MKSVKSHCVTYMEYILASAYEVNFQYGYVITTQSVRSPFVDISLADHNADITELTMRCWWCDMWYWFMCNCMHHRNTIFSSVNDSWSRKLTYKTKHSIPHNYGCNLYTFRLPNITCVFTQKCFHNLQIACCTLYSANTGTTTYNYYYFYSSSVNQDTYKMDSC